MLALTRTQPMALSIIPKIYIIMLVMLSIKNRQKKRHNALIFFGEKPPPKRGRNFITFGAPKSDARVTPTVELPPQRGEEIYAIDSKPMPYARGTPAAWERGI